jgi:MFS family permease
MKSLPLSERKKSVPNAFAWATLLLLSYAIGLIRCVDWFIIGALLTPIKTELQLPDEQLGQIGAVFFVASSFTSPIFGYLGGAISDKQNLRIGMLVAPTAFVISAFLLLSYTLLRRRRALVQVPTTGLASA